jgi:hypothetical protein
MLEENTVCPYRPCDRSVWLYGLRTLPVWALALNVRAGTLTMSNSGLSPWPTSLCVRTTFTNGLAASAPVPEPGIRLLIAVGLGTMVVLACRR